LVTEDGADVPLSNWSRTRQAITEREAEISALTAKTLGREKGSVQSQIRDLRKFVTTNLRSLRALFSSEENALAMRMELAKHIQEIVITPGETAGEIKYKGKWDLLGDGNELRNRGCAEGAIRSLSPLLEFSVPFEGVLGKAA